MPIIIGGVPAAVPFASTLLAPLNASYEDLSGTPKFDWMYNPGEIGKTQTAWAFRRKAIGGAYQWWNVSTTAWQSSPSWHSSSSQTYTFPSGSWVDGRTYNWSVATQDTNGQGPCAPDDTVVAQAGPTLTIVTPSGTITTAQPTISWNSVIGLGALQIAYRIIIYSAAQYGIGGFAVGVSPSTWDSGVIGSVSVSSVLPIDDEGNPVLLADSTSYKVYVQLTESGGMTSSWAVSSFATSWVAPATPTFTAVDGTDGVTAANIVTLTVTGHDAGSTAAYVGHTFASLLYSDDAGDSWFPVRDGTNVPLPSVGQQCVVIDYEAPPGFTRQYTAVVTANV